MLYITVFILQISWINSLLLNEVMLTQSLGNFCMLAHLPRLQFYELIACIKIRIKNSDFSESEYRRIGQSIVTKVGMKILTKIKM